MIKVSDVVKDMLVADDIAMSAFLRGQLNLSAYAASIQLNVERAARKPVRPGTIVVALSRLKLEGSQKTPLQPELTVDSISVKTGLIELAFDKTKNNREKLQRLYTNQDFMGADFLAITHGVSELSIIVPSEFKRMILKTYGQQKPTLYLENLAGLTLRFQEKYIQTPNIIYALLRPLALKRINVVEIVSTFTELTVIIDEDDLTEVFLIAKSVLKQKNQKPL